MRERINAIMATGATGAQWLMDAHELLSVAVTVLTLAWWIRLWMKNPNIEPPKINHEIPAQKPANNPGDRAPVS